MIDNENNSVVINLLNLFDALSREFHSLNTKYEQLLQKENTAEIKEALHDIKSRTASILEMTNQITPIAKEILSNRDVIDESHNKLYDKMINIEMLLNNQIIKFERLNDEFFSDIKIISEFKNDLEPLTKFSKLVAKPLGAVVAIIIVMLGILSAYLLIDKAIETITGTKHIQYNSVQKNINTNKPVGTP